MFLANRAFANVADKVELSNNVYSPITIEAKVMPTNPYRYTGPATPNFKHHHNTCCGHHVCYTS